MHLTYTEIDHEQTPLGKLTLRRYQAETGESGYEILIDGNFLMATHGAHSEAGMARLAYDRLSHPTPELRVLVGGLGAGHTLRAALDLPGASRVTVVEIGAKLVEWNRLYFAEVNRSAVDDPRVDIRIIDLGRFLQQPPGRFDLLLLDVDNGPGWLAAPGNAGLYENAGLADCRGALEPGGVLAIWSPQPNEKLRLNLQKVFSQVEEVDTTSLGKPLREPGDTVYLAVNSAEN